MGLLPPLRVAACAAVCGCGGDVREMERLVDGAAIEELIEPSRPEPEPSIEEILDRSILSRYKRSEAEAMVLCSHRVPYASFVVGDGPLIAFEEYDPWGHGYDRETGARGAAQVAFSVLGSLDQPEAMHLLFGDQFYGPNRGCFFAMDPPRITKAEIVDDATIVLETDEEGGCPLRLEQVGEEIRLTTCEATVTLTPSLTPAEMYVQWENAKIGELLSAADGLEVSGGSLVLGGRRFASDCDLAFSDESCDPEELEVTCRNAEGSDVALWVSSSGVEEVRERDCGGERVNPIATIVEPWFIKPLPIDTRPFGVPAEWLEAMRRAEVLSLDRETIHVSHTCDLEVGGQVVHVVDLRQILAYMKSPRGLSYIVLIDAAGEVVQALQYLDERPMRCDGDKLLLYGALGVPWQGSAEKGNVLVFSDGGREVRPTNVALRDIEWEP